MQNNDDAPLPRLRDDLQLLAGADDGDGSRGFLIFDPVRNNYFRITSAAAQILGAWDAGSIAAALSRLHTQGLVFAREEIETLIEFVTANNLVMAGRGQSQYLAARFKAGQKSLIMKALHGYLFFKIPLVRPQRFLNATFGYVRWLGSRPALWGLVLVSLFAIYLTARQFDVFIHQFSSFNIWQGVLYLPLALLVLKSAHELGHAYVATRYKCRVPTMGVAFMVMFPMLYSDVSDAWKLKNKNHRLAIDFAGMATEISLGGICLLLWNLLPEGPVRSLCFFMATTGWIMSLTINLSPFMRFDGYHILADWLGVHNLQTRGFEMGRWKLRKVLFGFDDAPPEDVSVRLRRILVAYAWGTWVYRFFLFLGIALLVYYMFFKLLGVFLFVVEIAWFVVLPMWRELKVWWQRRGDIAGTRRGLATLSGFAVLAGLMFLPLSRSVSVPAVLVAAQESRYFAPASAVVEEIKVKPGDRVSKGDVLVRLKSQDLREKTRKATLKLALVDVRLDRGMANDREKALRMVLLRERKALVTQLAGLEKQRRELVVTARNAGVVREVAQGLHPQRWISANELLVQVVSTQSGFVVRGLVDETGVGRLKPENNGVFVAEVAGPAKVPVMVTSIGLGKASVSELSYLSSRNSGGIAMITDSAGNERAAKAVFPVRFKVTGKLAATWVHEQRGTAVVEAVPQSLAGRFFRHAFSVLLRETGF